MTDIPFAKAHGLGNDFLLVEEAALGPRSAGELAAGICDRHTGVGADGLVPLAPAGAGRWKFRIFNADGGEAGLSGNAMRCAAAWLVSRMPSAEPGLVLTLETRVGAKRHTFLGRRGNEWIFQGEIVRPDFTAQKIPFHPPKPAEAPALDFPLPVGDETLPVTPLWMGNPQCIVFVDNFEEIDWRGLGPEIEHHPYFPERANAGFVRVLGPEAIEARFWERGAGHTLASGTGSCACAVAAALHGKTGRRVAVTTEIGQMQVHWREDDDVVELTGPAELVFDGVFHQPD
ncbi:MAG TPA: diaminopimelate epimerase [Patescibacteria group bacterium]|nr:diaminopimelate epimerase [Patescibacteria group bacterium]